MSTTTSLGIQCDPGNSALLQKLTELESYDFSPVTKDVEKKFNWCREKIEDVERQTKQFFALAFLDPSRYHIPEVDVDEYWHRMILHTRWYLQFCDDVFGSYYHHTPEPDANNLSIKNRERTQKLAQYWFGTEWRHLVRTCTQCRGPNMVTSLSPAPHTMPNI